MKIENVDIRINDIDHIWYNNKQYISLNRVNQMLRDKRTETHSCDYGRKETHGDMISRQAAIDYVDNVPYIKDYPNIGLLWKGWIEQLPSAEPEWNNHTVACLLAELFDDTCACNFNGIDEWLPEKCEVINSCPHPVGVACWEQFLKHRAEGRTDETDYRKE